MKILIDASNLFYRIAFTLGQQFSVEAVYFGVLRSLYALKKEYPEYDQFLCLDRYPKERFKLYPEYKAGRTKAEGGQFVKQLDPFKFLCVCYVAFAEEHEADDVIATLAQPNDIIYSADDDFLQLLTSKNIKVLKPKSFSTPQRIVDENYVLEKYGVLPNKLLFFRIVRGDTSDNIKGIPRFNGKALLEWAENSNTIEEFISGEKAPEKYKDLIKSNKEILERNFKLMTLKTDLQADIKTRTNRLELLQDFMNEMEMNSLIPKLKDYKTVFNLIGEIKTEDTSIKISKFKEVEYKVEENKTFINI